MNSSQAIGTADRAVTVLATWFLGFATQKGWITAADATAFLPILVAIPAVAWGWWNNRKEALVASTSSLQGVKGMEFTDPSLAAAAKAADPNTQVKLS